MPAGDIHLETEFEKYVARKLTNLTQLDGVKWVKSDNDKGFDAGTALVFDDFIEYQRRIDPEKLERMQKQSPNNWRENLKRNLIKYLEKPEKGTIQVLRYGFPMAGFQNITCAGAYPYDPRDAVAKHNYENNVLRVMRQVHYQTQGKNSIDLAFFINGIAVATCEIKTEMTQTVHDAIIEYQTRRKPIEPDTKRKNPLLAYKRGAVVHFAMSEDEVWMCTDLSPKKPKFLPFNRGNDGHAGNPPMQKGDAEYPTGYFWNDICMPENWVRIFTNFIFEEVDNKRQPDGSTKLFKVQLFPRYHQWDSVLKIIADVKENGPGQHYLIEHSAGSGKTETISWTAHELIRLRDENGNKVFTSVIVVTNRVALDTNIKKTIPQLTRTRGVIELIDDTSGSKNGKLVKALEEKREIIVVTVQTFKYALQGIATLDALKDANFAVIIDEAHQGQGGSDSQGVSAALMFASSGKAVDLNREDYASDEEFAEARTRLIQESHLMPTNVSFMAFTATPKAETKTLFGTPSGRFDDSDREIMTSFHLYPMRQAIEEGYILDVLKGYMPYKTAYKIASEHKKDALVDPKKAFSEIAKWQSLQPTNVMEKVEFIIEHFMKNVAHLLDGHAKAMVVTSSRPNVVRYKYAIDAYIKAHPEYDRDKVADALKFYVPGEPLVAFSGKVNGTQAIVDEDKYLEDNPFAMIRRDYDYTEVNMNELGHKTIEDAFEDQGNRFLIVCDKFQVGFNQPKLCAMYIDKYIANDIEIVQTYSRLNRTYHNKEEVFIVDFVNDPDTVVAAFKKYDNGAEMCKAQDPDIVYDDKEALDEWGIYTLGDFEDYKAARVKEFIAVSKDEREASRTALYNAVAIPTNRWKEAMDAAVTEKRQWHDLVETSRANGDIETEKMAAAKLNESNEAIKHLLGFRKKLHHYHSAYSFISQAIAFEDPELEAFDGFAKLLGHRLRGGSSDDFDVSGLVMTELKLVRLTKPETPEEATPLRPMSKGGESRTPKEEWLSDILAAINEMFPGGDPLAAAIFLNGAADFVETSDMTLAQIKNPSNSKETVLAGGRIRQSAQKYAMTYKNEDYDAFADSTLSDSQSLARMASLLYDLVLEGKRISVEDLRRHILTES